MSEATGAPRWVPLESNPEVMTKYTRTLGATEGQWVDVYGFDDCLLDMVPKPVQAVILLFPITPQYDEYCKERDAKLIEAGQKAPTDVFYMKQTVHNACGTVGVFHALANNLDAIKLVDGTLKDFLKETASMTPTERGFALENSNSVASAHEEIASEGQTAAPSADDQLVTHFVTFVHKNGQLYELDGRRGAGPVDHGPTTADNLLKDAARICQERIKTIEQSGNGNEYRFTVVALTTGTPQE